MKQWNNEALEQLQVLYEDNHLIVVNKSNHDIVQGDKTGDLPLSEKVKAYLKKKYNKPGNVFIGVIHRLDRPTSGVVVFARTSKALARMNRLFQQKDEVGKIYWAVVDKKPQPPAGELEHYLVRNRDKNKSYAFDQPRKASKPGKLIYRWVAASDNYHLLEIELQTGRHHQIRAQLAHKGVYIKGDLKYGFPRSNKNGGIHLHARQITFRHPVRDVPLTITAPPPNERLWNVFAAKAKANR